MEFHMLFFILAFLCAIFSDKIDEKIPIKDRRKLTIFFSVLFVINLIVTIGFMFLLYNKIWRG